MAIFSDFMPLILSLLCAFILDYKIIWLQQLETTETRNVIAMSWCPAESDEQHSPIDQDSKNQSRNQKENTPRIRN